MKLSLVVLTFFVRAISGQTILDIVANSPNHTVLTSAVTAAPTIAGVLSNDTAALTLFAPDDAAFAKLVATVGKEYITKLLTENWAIHLSCFLTSHVLESAVKSTDITASTTVASLSGFNLTVVPVDNTVTVNDIPVTTADIKASNGVVHVLSESPLLPPCVTKNIGTIASESENFSTIVSLIMKANLTEALAAQTGMTVLAPINEAFDAIPAYILDYLGNNITALTEILTYHIILTNEMFDSSSDMSEKSFTTLEGQDVFVASIGGKIVINNGAANVTLSNVLGKNGIIQGIDGVLIPPKFALPADPDAPPSMPTMATMPSKAPAYTPTNKMSGGETLKSGGMSVVGIAAAAIAWALSM